VTFFSSAPNFQDDDVIAAGDLDGDGFAEVAIGHVDIESNSGPGGSGTLSLFSAPGRSVPGIFPAGQSTFAFNTDESIAIGRRSQNVDLDSDGDGLLDAWEANGIDFDHDGCIDLDLPSLGADPMRKDVFVEIDAMDCNAPGGDCASKDTHNHMPPAANLAAIVTAYSIAPVPNPGGGPNGINLHLQLDELITHQSPCEFDSTCFDQVKKSFFGTATERAGITRPTCNSSSAAVLGAKSAVFHYNLWGHSMKSGKSGIAEEPGNDLMVLLGGYGGMTNGTPQQQAGTFMHELGHNLGLGHGGGDEVNRKPNYQSAMNYSLQFGFPGGAPFDYSRVSLPDLFETGGPVPNLDENVGIQGSASLATMYTCPNGDLTQGAGSGPIDWDCTPPATDRGYVGDINGDRYCVAASPAGPLLSTPAGDDFVMGGSIGPGPNMKLDSIIKGTGIQGDDVIVGQAVFPGPDKTLETAPANDDVVVNRIDPGADGQVESIVVGDDVAIRIVTPGANGVLETTPAGDDVVSGNTILPGPDQVLESAPAPGSDDAVVTSQILPGADLLLESTLAPGSDDVFTPDLITPGPDGQLDSDLVSAGLQGDDVVNGSTVNPGPDGILQTTAARDDVVSGESIVDGPNRTCDSTMAQGDQAAETPRSPGDVEPAQLKGFEDWNHLDYQFRGSSDYSDGVHLTATAVEMTASQAQDAIDHLKVADVGIGVTASAGQATLRSLLTYHVSVTNSGSEPAVGVTIEARLPSSATVVACATAGGPCTSAPGLAAVGFDSLAPGSSALADITVRIGCGAAVGSVAHALFSVRSVSVDPDPSNDSATVATTIVAPAPTASSAGPTILRCPDRSLDLPGSRDVCGNETAKTVVASDNPAISVPFVLSGPNATLPAGTYTVQYTEFDGKDTVLVTQTIRIYDVCLADLAVYATDALAIGEDTHIVESTSGFAPAASAGVVETDIGSDGQLGSIFSVAPVAIDDGTHVYGLVKSSGAISRGSGVVVDGPVEPNAALLLPSLSTFPIAFPPATGGNVSVGSSRQASLSPGSYANVQIGALATLHLTSGTYFFESLQIGSAARISTDASGGRVTVHVANSLGIAPASIGVSAGVVPNLLLVYQGSQEIQLVESFAGTLVAPLARVTLSSQAPYTLRGAFFARDVVVEDGVAVEHVALP
jgi:uncharacterized repeat protein (TIGR01451 family)